MRDAPEIGFLLARRLALRVKTLVERLNDRSVRSVRSRLAEFLLERHSTTSRPTISMGMTQRSVAEELGTVREVLARELQALAKEGTIAARGGGRYDVLLTSVRNLGAADTTDAYAGPQQLQYGQ